MSVVVADENDKSGTSGKISRAISGHDRIILNNRRMGFIEWCSFSMG